MRPVDLRTRLSDGGLANLEGTMYRTMIKSEIYTLTVSRALLHPMDSITIDADLVDAADLRPGERVTILSCDNGARVETCVVRGERGSGIVAVNGPAVHLIRTGDRVCIASYAAIPDAESRSFRPSVVIVDDHNRPIRSTS